MAVSNSHNDQSLSSLDSSVFSGLISRPRFLSMQTESTDVDALVQELRTQIVSKLDKNPGQSITTVGEMLRLSPTALLHILDPCLTYVECKRLIARICETCSVQPVTALDVMQRTNLSGVASSNGKLSTGLPTLDMQLRGGFSVSSITEVVGRAGETLRCSCNVGFVVNSGSYALLSSIQEWVKLIYHNSLYQRLLHLLGVQYI